MNSMEGITIAFVCLGHNHPSVICYNTFGQKYWDDTHHNKSKIGYYFLYYYQQKYVYVHKIVNILPTTQRPPEMKWNSERQILCLSPKLATFTWENWKNKGAPYTPTYRMTQTASWSLCELHKKFPHFSFEHLLSLKEKEKEINDDKEAELKEEFRRRQLMNDEEYRVRLHHLRVAQLSQLQEKEIERLIKERTAIDKEIESVKKGERNDRLQSMFNKLGT
jgi:hypothetical protein